jgi:hypothetical protein
MTTKRSARVHEDAVRRPSIVVYEHRPMKTSVSPRLIEFMESHGASDRLLRTAHEAVIDPRRTQAG